MTDEVEIERFQTRGDDGNEYTVVIFQEVRDAGTLENPNATVLGLKRASLIGGGVHLARCEGDGFQTPGGGLKLTRI
nr:hypothetical protein [Amylibacter sp.]